MNNALDSPVQYVKGVGPKKAELFEKLGVRTVMDLLFFFPRVYVDRRVTTPIAALEPGDAAAVSGEIRDLRIMRYGYRKSKMEAMLADDSGAASAVWFNQAFLAKHLAIGVKLKIFGQVKYNNGMQLMPEEWEIVRDDADVSLSFGRIVPVYRLTSGLRQKDVRRITAGAVENYAHLLDEFLPPDIVKKKKFPPLPDAMRDVHWPRNSSDQARAIKRFKFDELFLMELVLTLTRERFRRMDGNVVKVSKKVDERIRARFPFNFTDAQDRAVREITADLAAAYPMHRLLQGDVGSGKTAVAVYAMLAAIAGGHQAAVMAPTEILAEQHYFTLRRLLENSRTGILLLTGGEKQAARREKLAAIKGNRVHITVGTHALLQEDVEFANLGLVVVDEQHKFGVIQRARLREKGRLPDMLVMTATPIPRTLAMTAFGDLDVSIIDEMPPGRKPVTTQWIRSADVHSAYNIAGRELSAGRQAFVVYPVIEDSDRLNLRGAKKSFERIGKEVFPEYRVALLHGAMKSGEKDAVMTDFRAHKFDVLVSTVVIEVGIDVPNATVMLVEHADRFGLAQLHQLRGRIGRGTHESVCLLVGEAGTPEAAQRLTTLASVSDGFKIAEEDLRMRGPGEFLGTRQHGLPELRVADLVTDYNILVEARTIASEIVRKGIGAPEYERLSAVLNARFPERMQVLGVG